jgi:hypothetical protein
MRWQDCERSFMVIPRVQCELLNSQRVTRMMVQIAIHRLRDLVPLSRLPNSSSTKWCKVLRDLSCVANIDFSDARYFNTVFLLRDFIMALSLEWKKDRWSLDRLPLPNAAHSWFHV